MITVGIQVPVAPSQPSGEGDPGRGSPTRSGGGLKTQERKWTRARSFQSFHTCRHAPSLSISAQACIRGAQKSGGGDISSTRVCPFVLGRALTQWGPVLQGSQLNPGTDRSQSRGEERPHCLGLRKPGQIPQNRRLHGLHRALL